jgi:hypothetical protein
MQPLPELSIGDSSFESIRLSHQLYVDKTRYIFEMVSKGKYYFLSRPRRFGKSLTVSTLKCLFQGRKDLFDGLWISKHGDWEWTAHPVVSIDFNSVPHQDPDIMRESLALTLKRTAGRHDVSIETQFIETQFQELILALEKKFGVGVVVLVDEYDKPIISHLGKGRDALEIAKENREIMKYFFGVLKGANITPCLRFVFFTGVSKFSRVSIFSELNNLNDITMHRRYAEMLGYTQSELETDFAGYTRAFAEERGCSEAEIIDGLKDHYNGYRFSEKDVKVYNPFSVLKALDEKAFKNYWFETGTPTFLVDLLRERHFPLPMIETLQTDETMFSTYEIENLKPEAILFQTGYITIKDIDEEERIYCFDYPNREVKTSFLKHLLSSFVEASDTYLQVLRLSNHLKNEDLDAFFETMTAIFAAISHTLKTQRNEAWFHTIFYLMVSASGANVRSEVLHYRGRIDLVVEFSDKIYIIEFKCNRSAKAALKQIHDKGYADMFRQSGKKITLMGVNFDSEKRNVAEWVWETLKGASRL